MKRFAFLLAGVAIATVLVWGVAYALGWTLDSMGIRLYESEDDQQRNLNIVLGVWLVCAVLGGWLGWRRGAKRHGLRQD